MRTEEEEGGGAEEVLRDAAARQRGSVLESLFPWKVLCFKLTYPGCREDQAMHPSAVSHRYLCW